MESGDLPALSRLAQRGSGDHWQSLAILTSVGLRPWLLWKLLPNPSWLSAPDEGQAWFIDKLAALIADSRDDHDLLAAAAALRQDKLPSFAKTVLLSELLQAQKSNPTLRKLLSSQDLGKNADGIVAEAERAALSTECPLPARLAGRGTPW